MSSSVEGSNVGTAWLAAYDELMGAAERQLTNLMVTIRDPLQEDRGVRAALERHLSALAATPPSPQKPKPDRDPLHSVHTVANTIFPISLYQPQAPDAAARFFRAAEAIGGRHASHEWGSYLARLVGYETKAGKINQLERFLATLSGATHYKDRYEAVATYPGETLQPDLDAHGCPPAGRAGEPAADLHVIGPSDRRTRGGPCLAHLSLTLIEGRLHMTALYRRHHYIARAYGNFLGLARLLNFLAVEGGYAAGELVVVGTHALLDAGSVPSLEYLRDDAHRRAGDTHAIETATRPLGATWRDLDLPAPPSPLSPAPA